MPTISGNLLLKGSTSAFGCLVAVMALEETSFPSGDPLEIWEKHLDVGDGEISRDLLNVPDVEVVI